jgi:hypothetical protein
MQASRFFGHHCFSRDTASIQTGGERDVGNRMRATVSHNALRGKDSEEPRIQLISAISVDWINGTNVLAIDLAGAGVGKLVLDGARIREGHKRALDEVLMCSPR